MSRSRRGAPSITSGSTLTNSVSGARWSDATAVRRARLRHALSSSARQPSARAAANSASRRFERAAGRAAGERLVADDGRGVDVDDRLEDDLELIVRDQLPYLEACLLRRTHANPSSRRRDVSRFFAHRRKIRRLADGHGAPAFAPCVHARFSELGARARCDIRWPHPHRRRLSRCGSGRHRGVERRGGAHLTRERRPSVIVADLGLPPWTATNSSSRCAPTPGRGKRP